jgi:hypothetical protein
VLFFCRLQSSFSFTALIGGCRQHQQQEQQRQPMIQQRQELRTLRMVGDLFLDISTTVRTKDFHDKSGENIVDKNGNLFVVGGVVRICASGLKAFQTNSKGFGRYNAEKEFVPDSGADAGAKKCLELPEGLRGVVTKVYDERVISANLPIQVKFASGAHADEGYDAPTTFLMHFAPEEVECVL